jgi:hypothetical protein
METDGLEVVSSLIEDFDSDLVANSETAVTKVGHVGGVPDKIIRDDRF